MSYSMLYQSPVGNLEIITDGEVVTQLEYLYQYTHLRFPTNHDLYILIRFHMESLLLTERLPNISVNY